MAVELERCHAIRTYSVADFDFAEALSEVFASMAASWPNVSFRDFAATTQPVAEEDAFRLDLTFNVIHP